MPLTVGLIGAGSAALRAHLPALTRAAEADAVRVVGVVDPRAEHVEDVRRRCPGASPHPDAATLVARTHPDLLVIASPPSTHLDAVEAAFRGEVDVVCEKPLGVAPGDAERLEELVAAHPDRLLAPVHQYRFAPAWATVAAAAAAALAQATPFRLRVEVERPGTDPLSSGGWRAEGLREGGVLGDHGVHYIALAWTLGQELELRTAAQRGAAGREAAEVVLGLGADAEAFISVSYAGARRRNLVELCAGERTVRWQDGELAVLDGGDVAEWEVTTALSDRAAVNHLYVDLYDELLAHREEPVWRATRTSETLTVARVLADALETVRRG